MYKLRKSINTWINLHSQSLLKKRSLKHKTGLKCTAQDLPLDTQLVRTKTCSHPFRNQSRETLRRSRGKGKTNEAFVSLWKRQKRLSFSCVRSPVYPIPESHRIPYVLSIEPHIDLTLLKTIIQLFSHFAHVISQQEYALVRQWHF